jgi:hypothetical protein
MNLSKSKIFLSVPIERNRRSVNNGIENDLIRFLICYTFT